MDPNASMELIRQALAQRAGGGAPVPVTQQMMQPSGTSPLGGSTTPANTAPQLPQQQLPSSNLTPPKPGIVTAPNGQPQTTGQQQDQTSQIQSAAENNVAKAMITKLISFL